MEKLQLALLPEDFKGNVINLQRDEYYELKEQLEEFFTDNVGTIFGESFYYIEPIAYISCNKKILNLLNIAIKILKKKYPSTTFSIKIYPNEYRKINVLSFKTNILNHEFSNISIEFNIQPGHCKMFDMFLKNNGLDLKNKYEMIVRDKFDYSNINLSDDVKEILEKYM